MRGDPYENDDSDLWKLRREQREFLRKFPPRFRTRWAARPFADLTDIDLGRAEMLLRTTAAALLATSDLSAIEEAAEARLRFDVSSRMNKPEDQLMQVALVIRDRPELELTEMEALAYDLRSEIYNAALLCAWADRIAPDGYRDPALRVSED